VGYQSYMFKGIGQECQVQNGMCYVDYAVCECDNRCGAVMVEYHPMFLGRETYAMGRVQGDECLEA